MSATATADRQEMTLMRRLDLMRETSRTLVDEASRLMDLAARADREVGVFIAEKRIEMEKARNPRRAMR